LEPLDYDVEKRCSSALLRTGPAAAPNIKSALQGIP
jgi:hypothetical protein